MGSSTIVVKELIHILLPVSSSVQYLLKGPYKAFHLDVGKYLETVWVDSLHWLQVISLASWDKMHHLLKSGIFSGCLTDLFSTWSLRRHLRHHKVDILLCGLCDCYTLYHPGDARVIQRYSLLESGHLSNTTLRS